MKPAKIMNIITAVWNIIYLIFSSIFWILIVIEDSGYRYNPDLDIALTILLFISIFFAGVLFILGVITLIMNISVKNVGAAKPLGIVASSMTIAGFIIGWVPILSSIYMIATIIIYFVSAVTMKPKADQQPYMNQFQQY